MLFKVRFILNSPCPIFIVICIVLLTTLTIKSKTIFLKDNNTFKAQYPIHLLLFFANTKMEF